MRANKSYRPVASLFGGLLILAGAVEGPNTSIPVFRPTEGHGGPNLCGDYCLWMTTQIFGLPTRFNELVFQGKGPRDTRSIQDLALAARRIGIRAKAYAGISVRRLTQSTVPAILHVRRAANASSSVNHFVLYLGANDKSVVIWDPGNSLKTIPVTELQRMWDGNLLALSLSPIDESQYVSSWRKPLMIIGALFTFVGGMAAMALRSDKSRKCVAVGPVHEMDLIRREGRVH